MRLRDIFEDVESDVDASSEAEEARVAFLRVIENSPRVKWIENAKHLRIPLTRTNPDNPSEKNFSEIVIRRVPRFTQLPRGKFQLMNNGISEVGRITMFMNRPLTRENVIRYLNTDGAETFRHEYIHLIDLMSRQTDMKRQVIDDEEAHRQSPSEYYNDPAEFNAFFHEAAEPLLNILRTAKYKDIEAAQEIEKVEPDFKKFLRMQHFFSSTDQWEARANFNDHFKKRYIKRLYALHQAATAIQGMSAPFNPTKAQRIFRWLVDQLQKLPGGKK